ncbi:1-phosphofructokinase family hexose kinase [Galbitalea sp. SE-J8]|uniref:1-phosphofructokinase family hexose kinase n=1 Tax=Galbitalea sp. SE-J8 TaxID=3054952 RepID=UPI00259CB1DB|nr:1-phosphofructokinase family hexose kinase [Galbitalea sp. SE-J8]MDM4763092.1 1-phosphofructokinase family hexose kinase [Galbitalea sp. SE-J8]
MIVTLTLNPSLDRTLEVESLDRGAILRTGTPSLDAGGKGVNVTRALAANGIPSVAVVPVGGLEGAELVRLLERDGVEARTVPVATRTRSNIALVEPDGTVTKINEPGSPVTDAELGALVAAVVAVTGANDWVVVSGSLAPGTDVAQLATVTTAVTAAGAHLAVDTSGDALRAAVEVAPRLVKPNREELGDLIGRDLGSIAEVVEAAEWVRDAGVEQVLVSLGADGAVLVTPDGVIVGESTVVVPRSAVGAGDCFLAGYLQRLERDPADPASALLDALAWGAAAAALPGTSVPAPAEIARADVRLVRRPDPDRPLLTG